MKRLLLAALLLAPLAGCIAGDEAPPAALPPAVSEPLYELSVSEHLPMRMDDGATIDAWVFRPQTDEPVPVIINFSPYWSNLAPPAASGGDAFSAFLLDYFVPRGYAVALVSVRGTGNSEGCFTIGGAREIADADAVATALATAGWANGNATAIAKSYDGTVAQGLLTRANPHVRTIVPVSPISEFYKYNYFDGLTYSGQGETFNALYVDAVSLQQSDDPTDETWTKTPTRFCEESADVQRAGVESALTGDYTEYWRERNYTALLPETLDASVFYIHGLADWNVKPDHMDPWIDALRQRNVTIKMWLGQWGHDYPTRSDFNETLLRWLDHELKGIDNGIMDEPLVDVEDDTGTWRHEDLWPRPDAQALRLYPSADGTLGDAPGAGTSVYADGAALPVAPASVRFESAPLPRALRLVGVPTFEIAFSSTHPRASLVATLYAGDKIADQGFLDLLHWEGMESGSPLTPGETYRTTVRFYPQDVLLPAGSRLALVVSHETPEDAPVAVQPPPTQALVTLVHGEGTLLTLPVIEDDPRTLDPQPDDVGCWAC
ncbi:MAG TPA: CocE/NonD family hydrolase [Candidatus Thermoplasmatota archaeon]|nr:CocE/NonD family hydrolase [Candidatus Thermoplasmatota archaeon]